MSYKDPEGRKLLYEQRRKAGLCCACGQPNDSKFTKCTRCIESNHQQAKKLDRTRIAQGLCIRGCGRKISERSKCLCDRHLEMERKRTTGNPKRHAQYKEWRLKLKREVFAHYGKACYCCGETNINCLNIDHIQGGGSRQRREVVKGGHYLYKWLIDHNFPKGYQTACFSCNVGRSLNNGVCPAHEEHSRIKQLRNHV